MAPCGITRQQHQEEDGSIKQRCQELCSQRSGGREARPHCPATARPAAQRAQVLPCRDLPSPKANSPRAPTPPLSLSSAQGSQRQRHRCSRSPKTPVPAVASWPPTLARSEPLTALPVLTGEDLRQLPSPSPRQPPPASYAQMQVSRVSPSLPTRVN